MHERGECAIGAPDFPFFVEVQTKGGGPAHYSFKNMGELQSTCNKIRADEPLVRN